MPERKKSPQPGPQPEPSMFEKAQQKAEALARQLSADAQELLRAGEVSAAEAVRRAADAAQRVSEAIAAGKDGKSDE